MLDWSLDAEDALLDNRYSLWVSLGGNGSKGWCGKFMSRDMQLGPIRLILSV